MSEVVLEVQSMERAVQFWSNQLGFPIVEQWGYDNGQFTEESNGIWATWLYVGGPTRLGSYYDKEFLRLETAKQWVQTEMQKRALS
ncbi:VOC family protein [Priestia flexa]|uniref:VOC family protein n=1 Tax=Priestia flexa TaxID=86664 RepID=UPI0036F2A56B